MLIVKVGAEALSKGEFARHTNSRKLGECRSLWSNRDSKNITSSTQGGVKSKSPSAHKRSI